MNIKDVPFCTVDWSKINQVADDINPHRSYTEKGVICL